MSVVVALLFAYTYHDFKIQTDVACDYCCWAERVFLLIVDFGELIQR